MILTRQQLLRDLYTAYYCAKRNKSKMSYVKTWESHLRDNMELLCDDLFYRRYKPLPSKCFIVDYPKKREIFAAMFRDRIVHHLYFNYTHEMFERTFIQDSYSCIKDRGTHYGINRITDFCRKESHNWKRKCYALQIDIRGYFMHIDRHILLDLSMRSLDKMATHKVNIHHKERWCDVLDIDFIKWLNTVIVMLDPRDNCIIVGNSENWKGLDPNKSMLNLKDGIGLPIGNLTSQLFSNVYLNELDQYCKRKLKCKYYGRYVDDAIIVSSDKNWLLSLVTPIEHFLKEELHLNIHKGKLKISEVHQGIEFLGAYIKPYRTYISNETLQRVKSNFRDMLMNRHLSSSARLRTVNSYLGILSHYSSFKIRRRMFQRKEILRLGVLDDDMKKITERHQYFYSLFKTI